MAGLLFAAGFETTTNLLANGLVALLRHPAQIPALLERPEAAVEELVRYDSPVQLVSRVAWEPAPIAGVEIEPGERVVAKPARTGRALPRDSLTIRGYLSLPVAFS